MDESKAELYQLIVSQLKTDGFSRLATKLSVEVGLIPRMQTDEERLHHLVQAGQRWEEENGSLPHANSGGDGDSTSEMAVDSKDGDDVGIDFEQEKAKLGRLATPAASRPKYQTKFITTHKGPCITASFSPDGQLVATGSADFSIKLLDVEKMVTFNDTKLRGFDPPRPVIRTYYDHTQAVSGLHFHPFQNILVSGSRDCTVKFLDTRTSSKRAYRFYQDSHPVRCVMFHPGGDHLIIGTDHCMVRLYDVNTRQALTTSIPTHHHYGPINSACYNSDGRTFVTCSKDGFVRIWDGVSLKCAKFIANAHDGRQVSSAAFSKNGHYVLTSGKDSSVRLWDLRTGNQLRVYTGHTQTKTRVRSTFSHNEDFILSADESNASVLVWNTRTGEVAERLTGHNNVVRWIATCPTRNYIMTCSADSRARIWVGQT